MSEKELRPDIRFRQFDDGWKERKLKDFAVKQIKKNSDGKIEETFTNSAEFGVISQLDYFDHNITNESNITGYTIIGDDDFVYNPRISATAPVGPINRNSLGRAGVMSPLYTIFRADNTTNHLYLEYYFKTSLWHPFMYHEGNTGARFDRFSIGDKAFFDMPVTCPSIQEQELVAKTLKSLDRLILLEQKKQDDLKNTKSAMLVKMFPKEGKTVPEVRFEGFSGEWGKCTLGEVATFSKGSGYSKDDLRADGTPIILYGRLYTKYETAISLVDTFVTAKQGSVYSRGGEVIVPGSGESAEDISIASVVMNPGIILGGDLNVINPPQNIDATFLAISITYGKAHQDMAKMAQGKSIVHLHNYDLAKVDLLFPTIDEQRTITRYFLSLDRLIALHQRKLDKLKDTKKAMLNKMFCN